MEPSILGPNGQPVKPQPGQVLLGVTELGPNMVNISMTYFGVESCMIINTKQAETLYFLLGAYLQDMQEKAKEKQT